MFSCWDPLLDFTTPPQLSQFTGLWNSPRSTMTRVWLMNMHSFSLTLWQSHYILCSTTVKAGACQVARVPSPSRGAGCRQDACPICRGLCRPSCSTSAWYCWGASLALRAGRRQRKAGSNSWILITGAASKDRVTPRGIPREGSHCSFTSGLSLPINTFPGPGAPTAPKASCLQPLLCIVWALSMCLALNTDFHPAEAKGHWALAYEPSGRWTGT